MPPSDERDFYEDEPQEQAEVIGWCNYCKCEIYFGEKKVEEDGKLFHKECYLLENESIEPGVNDE